MRAPWHGGGPAYAASLDREQQSREGQAVSRSTRTDADWAAWADPPPERLTRAAWRHAGRDRPAKAIHCPYRDGYAQASLRPHCPAT